MKKLFVISLFLGFCFLASSCSKETTILDTLKPKINIRSDKKNIEIRAGEEVDLLDGVSVIDNIDMDLFEAIKVVKGDYDPQIPGTYEIFFFVSDRAGNAADPMSKYITVLDTLILNRYPIYTGIIENEVELGSAAKCFGGAWYHKVVSTRDYWVGMEGTVTLPLMDINRYQSGSNIITNPALDVMPDLKNLDNPSIYMGGNATNESDVGLSLSPVKLGTGSISAGSVAFRPFWRYITPSLYADEGTYDLANGRKYAVSCTGSSSRNCIASYHPNYTEYYYLPGDKVRIIITSPEKNYMQLQIEVIEKSTLDSTVALRKNNGWNDPLDFKGPIFYSPGQGSNIKAEFKRVNAIDQSGNEGLVAIETSTYVKEAIWHESYLYRKIDGELRRVPMTSRRVNVMNCPNPAAFIINTDETLAAMGGEKIQIKPEGISNKLLIAWIVKKEDENILQL